MPSSCGASRMTSRRCSLPSKTASRSDWSMSPDGASASRCSRAAMTTLLATSPAACPPIPSAPASSRGPAYTESWLLPRIRPRSERAAYRRTRLMRPPRWRSGGARARFLSSGNRYACSRTQLQGSLPDADRLARTDQERTLHALLVEVGAVGRSEVLHVPLAAAVGQARVAGAGEVVGQDEGRVVGPADEDGLVAEGDLRPGQRSGGDHQGVLSPLSPLPTLPARDRRGARRHRRDPSGAAAEQVGPYHAEGGEDEQPQQQQEPEAEDLQDDFGHPVASPGCPGGGTGPPAGLCGVASPLTGRPGGRPAQSGLSG